MVCALALIATLGACSSARRPSGGATNDAVAIAKHAYDTAPRNARRVMVVGDSVADFLAPAMQHVHTTPPLAVFNAGVGGCSTLRDVTRDRSRRSNGELVVSPTFPCFPSWEVPAIQQFHPEVVVWIASSPPDELLQGNRWVPACSARYAAGFRAALGHEVARVGAYGAKVVITTSAYPRFGLYGSDAPADCENRLRREVAASTGAQLVDLFGFICPGGRCRTTQNGVYLRADGLHYTGAGAAIVAKWLISQLH